MAVQVPSSTQVGYPTVSAAAAFNDTLQRQYLANLERDLLTLRNAVDALVTAFNEQVTLFNAHTHSLGSSAYSSIPTSNACTVSGGTTAQGVAGVAPSTIVTTP
jgi:hypothetical protein